MIVAFQARPGSLLANVDSGLISIKLPDGTPLNSWDPLPNSGFDGNLPLVIASATDGITTDEFLQTIPPKIEFSLTNQKARESKSSGPRAHPKEPSKVVLWDDFVSNAASFHLGPSGALLSPNFVKYREPVSDEMDLQAVIKTNILNPLNDLLFSLNSNMRFTGHSEIASPVLKGWPDHVLHENHQLRSFIETKTIWDLPTPTSTESIVEWWKEDRQAESEDKVRQNLRPSCFHIFGQVYGYLSHHELKYGMIINGEVVWFLCRPNLPNESAMLLISPPISLLGKSPAIFQSIYYFISLISDGHRSGKSPDTSPATGQLPQTHVNRGSGSDVPEVPEDLELSQLNEKIGDGFCGVVLKYVMHDGSEIALKCCDSGNNIEGFRMMKNEVKMYQSLKALQGILIPELRFSGFCGEVFVIGTQMIHGNHLEGAGKEDVMIRLREKLAVYKVEHGDLREKNVLVDQNNKHWVIDFGKSYLIN